ncbi:CoA transferase [Nonomuraea thailandensis]
MTVTVMSVGDLVVDEPGPASFFAPARDVLARGDVVIGHVEVPHSTSTAQVSTDVPAPPADPAALAAIAEAGFHVVTLAGNHVYDAGDQGVADTVKHAAEAGLATTGAGLTLDEARGPALVERGGLRVGVLSYNCVGPRESWATTRKPGCAYIKVLTHYELDHASPGGPPTVYTFADPAHLERMAADVAALSAEADVVLVSLHKGVGHTPAALAMYEKPVARAAIDAGAHAVFAHHAHIMRGIEMYRGRPIYHGLGNFVTVTHALTPAAGDAGSGPTGRAAARSCTASPPTRPCRSTPSTRRAGTPPSPSAASTAAASSRPGSCRAGSTTPAVRCRSATRSGGGGWRRTSRTSRGAPAWRPGSPGRAARWCCVAEGPLTGRTVIDLTTALAGPYATLLLAGLGARVIKVENPLTGGDSSRGNSPYVGADGLTAVRREPDDMSVSMLLRGRNKHGVTLNLKHPAARDVLAGLVRAADVMVDNYSAGVTARLGIGHDWASAINPRIVCTSISGFGAQGGPGSGKAMDTIVQALSGVMMTAGAPGEPPVRFGLPVGDLLAPLYAVIGTLAAVIQADATGRGQHVDVSMLGALTSLVACEPFDAYERLGLPARTGATVPRLAPFGTFPAADGWFALCGPTDAFARGLFAAMDRPELAADPRFATRDARVAGAGELHGTVAAWAADRPLAGLLARHGVPAAEVRDPVAAVRDPIVLERAEVVPLEHPRHGDVAGLVGTGVPIRFSAAEAALDGPAPGLGEHNAEIYGGLLGYTDDELKALAEDGVI